MSLELTDLGSVALDRASCCGAAPERCDPAGGDGGERQQRSQPRSGTRPTDPAASARATTPAAARANAIRSRGPDGRAILSEAAFFYSITKLYRKTATTPVEVGTGTSGNVSEVVKLDDSSSSRERPAPGFLHESRDERSFTESDELSATTSLKRRAAAEATERAAVMMSRHVRVDGSRTDSCDVMLSRPTDTLRLSSSAL